MNKSKVLSNKERETGDMGTCLIERQPQIFRRDMYSEIQQGNMQGGRERSRLNKGTQLH